MFAKDKVERLTEDKPAREGAEYAFQTHGKAGDRRVKVPLGNDLQREGHAAGHNAAVGDGDRRTPELVDCRRFKDKHKDRGQHCDHQKLGEAELDAVQLGAEVVYHEDLQCEQQRTEQQLPLAAGQAERIAPRKAEQVQPHNADRHAAPQLDAGAAAQKDPRNRHQHHIQRRHKAGLGGAGRADAHLLGRRCRKQRRAAGPS